MALARVLVLAVLSLATSSQAASIAGSIGGRSTEGLIRDHTRKPEILRLRGGVVEAEPSAAKGSTKSKDDQNAWFMRSSSYSVLDESKVKEPGLDAIDASNSPTTNATEVLAAAHLAPVPSLAATETETEEFAKKAKEKSSTRSAGTECRVKAALEALDENAEKYEDFKRHNVVLVASEHAAYAKTGGLADVVDKLSLALALRGHRVMTIIPMYGSYEGAVPTGIHRGFGLFGQGHTIQYFHKWHPLGKDRWGNDTGVDHVFVDHPCFHRPGMYGEWGKDYEDNLMRFALFSWAAIEAPLCVPGEVPFGDDVIYVANDWQTGLVPLILTSHYRRQ